MIIAAEHPQKTRRKKGLSAPLGKSDWNHLMWKSGESLAAEVGDWEVCGNSGTHFYKIDNEVTDLFTVSH
jgi:hypothetical protein